MSSQSFVLPYLRTSPVHVPHRDMVLGRADSLALDVQIVDRDSPDGVPIELSGGIGGPTLQMLVWPDTCYRASWDYGAPWIGPRTVLWAATAVISDLASGTFIISFPTATMSSWPRRCAYALQLDEDGGSSTTLLAQGHLHLSRSVPRSGAPVVMLTDPMPPVLTDDSPADFILLEGTLPMSTTIGGVRIADMPDLGAFTSNSSLVGEHAGSGRFSASALGGYFLPLNGGGTVVLNTADLAPNADATTVHTRLNTSGSTAGYGISMLARVTAAGGTTAAHRFANPNIALVATPIKYIPAGGLPAGTTQLQDSWAILSMNYDCSNSSTLGGVICNEHDLAANHVARNGLRCGAQYVFTTLWPVGAPGPDNPFYGPTPATGGWPVEHGAGLLFTTGPDAVLNMGIFMAPAYNQALWDSRQAVQSVGTIQTTVAAGGTALHVSNVVAYMTYARYGRNGGQVSPSNPMPLTIGANTYSLIGAAFDAPGPGGVTTSLGTLTLLSGIIGTDGAAGNTPYQDARAIWLADDQKISWSTIGDVTSFADGGSLYLDVASGGFIQARGNLNVSGSQGIGGSLNVIGSLDMGSLGAPSTPLIYLHSSGHTTSDAFISSQGGSSTANAGTMLLTAAKVQVTNGALSFSPIPTNAANDGAAATAGVPVGAIYRNGSVVQIRVS